MEFFKLLQNRSRTFYFLLALLAIVNSVWSSLLLILINNTINKKTLPIFPEYDWLVFVVLIVAAFLASKFFQNYMISLTHTAAYEINMSIFDNLRFASYESFKRIGNQRVYSSISDAYTLGSFPQSFIEIFNSAIILAIVLVYFFFISVLGGIIVVSVVIALGMLFYFRNEMISKSLNRLRDLSEGYHQNIHDLLNGFANIKMSRKHNDNIYYKFLENNRKAVRDLSIETSKQYYDNELSGTFSWYVVIGFVIFVLPLFIAMDPENLSNYIVTILFLLSPLNSLLNLLPNMTRMSIALNRLRKFEEELNSDKMVKIGHGEPAGDVDAFRTIRLVDVEFEYYDAGKKEIFRLGPINATFARFETVFITGGNGSGKSTLINMIAGLTMPSKGQVYIDDVLLRAENIQSYRDRVAAILSGDYLFKSNYAGYDFSTQRNKLDEYLLLMGLSDVVRIDEKNEFIFTDLSKGQQKRLSMVHALMEDRPLLVLDEWAAEQDPQFRAFFYQELLPLFKKKGKTIILVTHDDRYFSKADRLLKMADGRLDESENVDHINTTNELKSV